MRNIMSDLKDLSSNLLVDLVADIISLKPKINEIYIYVILLLVIAEQYVILDEI